MSVTLAANSDTEVPASSPEVHAAGAFDPSGADVLAFAARERRTGKPVCIATVTEIYGTSPRARGSQMAVAMDGRSAGHVSSGCLERAIVAEAQAAMQAGRSRLVRYGQGSQYVDIALPCGSALQILFSVAPSLETLDRALDAVEARRPFALDFTLADGAAAYSEDDSPAGGHYLRHYIPRLRVIAAGQGAELTTVTRVVRATGYDMIAVSPDEAALAFCAQQGARTVRLHSAGGQPDLAIDRWTAVVLLFHEREWEAPILTRALASPAFYVGAVGSRRTAAARLEDLFAAGVSPDEAARLRGPIGLLASTRDPSALALSTLAEIVAAAPAA